MSEARAWLGERVDASSFAAFRFALGVVMSLESVWLLVPGAGGSTLERVFLAPPVELPYPGLEFVVIGDGAVLVAVVVGLGVCGVALALGVQQRLAAAGVALLWSVVWLQDASLYNNHHYLMSLLAGLLAFAPRVPSLFAPSAWASRATVPFACVAVLRFQLFVTYFFAGVAKCTPGWWTHAEPLRSQLALPATQQRLHALLPDAWVAVTSTDAFAQLLSRSGLFVDLLAGPLLLWRRTRVSAAVVLVAFHATNHFALFDDIGLFPLLGVLTLPIFFPPDWPRRLLRTADSEDATPSRTPLRWAATAAIGVFVVAQGLLPLRHFAIPGFVDWTGEGARFAWRMKSHAIRGGRFGLVIEDAAVLRATPDGRQEIDWEAWPGERFELQEVDPFDPRWSGRARFVVLWHPLVGERLIYNPHSREPGHSEHLALPRAPASRRDALVRDLAALAPDAPDERLHRLVAQVDEATSRAAARTAAAALAAAVDSLAKDPDVGAAARALLGSAAPFELEGGPAAVGDFEWVVVPSSAEGGFREIDFGGPRLAVAGAGAPRMHVALPSALVRRTLDGRRSIEWNARAELGDRRLQKVRTQPSLLLDYGRGVAGRWQTMTGRRPVVRADAFAALVPFRAQRLVDPTVDLAAEPIGNGWIMPLEFRASAESLSPY